MYDSIIELEEQADKIHKKCTEVYIVDTLKHYDLEKWENLSILDRKTLLDFAYGVYLKDESNISLGCICDSVMEHYKDILNGKIKRCDFLRTIAERWL